MRLKLLFQFANRQILSAALFKEKTQKLFFILVFYFLLTHDKTGLLSIRQAACSIAKQKNTSIVLASYVLVNKKLLFLKLCLI